MTKDSFSTHFKSFPSGHVLALFNNAALLSKQVLLLFYVCTRMNTLYF